MKRGHLSKTFLAAVALAALALGACRDRRPFAPPPPPPLGMGPSRHGGVAAAPKGRVIRPTATVAATGYSPKPAQPPPAQPAKPPHFVANSASAPAGVNLRKLRREPDITITTAVSRQMPMTTIDADVDWALPAPDGKKAVVGHNELTSRVVAGTAGEAWLYPGRKPVPVKRVVNQRHMAFSPDGKLLLVTSELNPTPLRRPTKLATPKVNILRMPKMRLVATIDGMEPRWLGPTSIALRRGRQAYRYEVGGAMSPIGVAQSSLGCLPEEFPLVPCKSDRWSHGMAPDPTLSRWLVTDNSSSRKRTWIRSLPLASDQPRELLTFNDFGQSLRPQRLSPDGQRLCGFQHNFEPQWSRLLCVEIATGKVDQLYEAQPDVSSIAWLDDYRLIFADSVPIIIDLAADTITFVAGLPTQMAAGKITPLAGGNRFVGHWGSSYPLAVIDLAMKSYRVARQPSSLRGASYSVHPPAKSDARFVVVARRNNAKKPALWVDVK